MIEVEGLLFPRVAFRGLPGLADAVHPGVRADEELVAGHRGGGHAHVLFCIQSIGAQQLEFAAGLQHVRHAVFIKEKDFAVVRPWRTVGWLHHQLM